MNVDPHAADGIPPWVWEQPEIRLALAQRDLRTVYMRLQRAGVSQRKIARLTGQSASEVYEILNGRQVMAYDLLVRVADGLGVPRGYMGLAYDQSTEAALDIAAATCSVEASEREEVRQLLSQAANVTMGTAVHDVARWWQPVEWQTVTVPKRIGLSDVAHVEALSALIATIDSRHGGGACREAVAAQTRWAQRLLTASSSDETRARLHVALADMHHLAGWTSFDVGMHSAARRHFSRALEQAKHVEDSALVAKILYCMGRLHLHRGMHRQGLRFFQLGQIAAQDSGCGVTVAMLCANEAWAYALLGDEPQLARSLGRAEDEFARTDHKATPRWVRFFGTADLHASIGVATACQPTRTDAKLSIAIEHLTKALDERDTAKTRSRTFELTALAGAHLMAGNRDCGLQAGKNAVAAAATVRSVRVLDRLRPLEVQAREQNGDPDLQDLAHMIASLRAA